MLRFCIIDQNYCLSALNLFDKTLLMIGLAFQCGFLDLVTQEQTFLILNSRFIINRKSYQD